MPERDSLLRGADRMAFEIIRMVDRGLLDTRSPAADAMLDYVQDCYRGDPDPIARARFFGTPERGYDGGDRVMGNTPEPENAGAGESGGLLNLG